VKHRFSFYSLDHRDLTNVRCTISRMPRPTGPRRTMHDVSPRLRFERTRPTMRSRREPHGESEIKRHNSECPTDRVAATPKQSTHNSTRLNTLSTPDYSLTLMTQNRTANLYMVNWVIFSCHDYLVWGYSILLQITLIFFLGIGFVVCCSLLLWAEAV
jgi:hypothetical protein